MKVSQQTIKLSDLELTKTRVTPNYVDDFCPCPGTRTIIIATNANTADT